MRIVVIDDDPDVHRVVVPFLTAEGYEVLSALNWQTGLLYVREQSPDLIVLDILIPEMDGWEICRQIRTFSRVPILMVSAIARESEDEIRGLELGASSYLVKPIDLAVFLARIKALIRLSTSAADQDSHPVYVDDHLMLNLTREEYFVKGERISLTYLEQSLLSLLVRNIDQTVPTEEIIEELWPDGTHDENVQYVRIYIRRLRKLLEPDPGSPRYIINYHGFGYRFCSRI
ncbi:MAG: response regulator transcription factor [Anaerolineae bacterium]|nr:response regulator transcription factor [Anaerolineae bacterium]